MCRVSPTAGNLCSYLPPNDSAAAAWEHQLSCFLCVARGKLSRVSHAPTRVLQLKPVPSTVDASGWLKWTAAATAAAQHRNTRSQCVHDVSIAALVLCGCTLVWRLCKRTPPQYHVVSHNQVLQIVFFHDGSCLHALQAPALPGGRSQASTLNPRDSSVLRFRNAVTRFSPGSHELLPGIVTSIPNVFVAGDCVKQGPGTHGCKGLSQEKAYVSGLQVSQPGRAMTWRPWSKKSTSC